jgi:zinc protease
VGVGSVDEVAARAGDTHGTTGLSHFFEHLMFQGTARYPNYDIALAPLGARSNAFTYQDATVYWSCAPSEHLGTLVDIEADRFEHMKVDFIHLEPEREVVKSERRQNVDADPGEVAEERAIRNTFDRFPYQWGPIGWMTDLDAITLEQARRYHAEHYTTDRTLLVLAGGFDPEKTLRTIASRWGHLKAPVRPPDFLARSEVTLLSETWLGPRYDYLLMRSSEPQAVWSYRAPSPSGPSLKDYVALELVDWALTGAKSGRLMQRLVYAPKPLVSNLSARLTPLRFPFAYVWRANLLPSATVDVVEQILDEELARIAREGLTPDELAQAVASLRADFVRSTLSHSDRAEAIGFSWASTGRPFALYERLALYETISESDLKAAASRWLLPSLRARVTIVSPERLVELTKRLADADPNAAPIRGLLSASVEILLRDVELARSRQEAERERHAIALLIERAERAKASTSEAQAIDTYMRGNEMGATQRQARSDATFAELDNEARALRSERRKLEQELNLLRKTSRANLAETPHVELARLLLTPLDVPLPAPSATAGSRRDLAAAQRLVIDLWRTFLLDLRGQERSAEAQRQRVIDEAGALLSAPLEEGASALARLTLDLARDSRREGLALEDTPMKRRGSR